MNRIVLYALFSTLIFSACKDKDPKKTLLPHVIGGMNDVVVVMSQDKWEGDAGHTLRELMLQQVPGIAQDERVVDLVWMPHDGFTMAVRKQRNILVTKIGPDYKAEIKYHKSLWAESQLVIQVMAKNEEEFVQLFKQHAELISNRIQEAELQRLMDSYSKSRETAVAEKLLNNHDVKLVVPKGYTVNLEDENFIWLDFRHRNVIEGIMVYYYPYTDSATFSEEFLVNKRNEILRKYVPGEKVGSYPKTEERFPIINNEYELNGNRYTYELRGLWHVVEGMAMGGPFISVSQYDEARGRIVTVDGFLFASGEEKRNLLKRLEAILYTLDFPEEVQEQ